jgi:acid stress-induced BolA-like protein IbaG/YrbA
LLAVNAGVPTVKAEIERDELHALSIKTKLP